jgi:hypothetical protein
MYRVDSAAVIYERNEQVELSRRGLGDIAMRSLMIVPKEKSLKEFPVGSFRGDRQIARWSSVGAMLGAVWGLIFDTAVLPIPGMSPNLFAGPLASWIAAVVQDAIVFGFIGALCAGLIRVTQRKLR